MENQSPLDPYYENEIDLRVYIQAIFSQWLWIIIPAVMIGGLVFLYTSFLPLTYKATALVSVSSPSLDVVFDDRIIADDDSPASIQNNDLPNLALSDAIIFDLFEQIKGDLTSQIGSFAELRDHLNASTETRSEIVVLSGVFEDSELSELVVNAWSQIFVAEANKFFEGSVEISQTFLQSQLETALDERDRINTEWSAFQAQNEIEILRAKLNSQKSFHQTYIDRYNKLELLQHDIEGMQIQIDESQEDESVLSDLALYALQNRAFGTGGNIQFEVSSFDALYNSTFSERIDQLNNLAVAIANQQVELESRISKIEPEILALQEQIASLQSEKAALESDRNIILDTYDTLAKKVAEGEIEQHDTTGRVQVAAPAITPVEAEPRGRVTTSVIAAVAVAAIATFVVLALAWWREENAENLEG